MLGLWSNVGKLSDASSAARANSTVAEGRYSAYDLERDRLDPSYTPNSFLPTAGNYLSAATAYGSMGLSPSELSGAAQAARVAADQALAGSLGLALTPAPSGRPPRSCVRGRNFAELELPAGGAWIGGDGLGDGTFTLGRFADAPSARLMAPAGDATTLRIPRDGADVPWRLQIASRNPVTVCGLP